ncbi:hypothetical protein DFH07DRAFT_388375 [Mycena maculata]|uniref:Uncharacterized protein n=1 Tax=Mycena maculata TaxID=230809 RepID=A0AAD7KF03_9AGAR|nr:hypothetical protein DFH07DRAFT_388375 [Mycena maculata]
MDSCADDFCAVCHRHILPKRTLVTVPANPPPSPTLDSTRRKTNRNGGGLVHGTGRVRPNGTIKGSPAKTRVEIDQSPAPLYCSDDCRQKDNEYFHGLPAYSESGSSSSDSSEEHHLPSYDSPLYRVPSSRKSTPNTRSLAVLQREYGLPPLPPRTSETYDEFAPRKQPVPAPRLEYTSGVMMANRRLEAVLPKPLKPGERAPPLKPVPGWTDGSQAWRASTYSFAPPPKTRADVLDPNRTAYEGFVASPHRSAQSGVTASEHPSSAPASPTGLSATPSSINSEMLSSFEDSFARRTASRISLFSPGTSPASSTGISPPRKQRPLAQAAVGGMLLVPDVMKRAAVAGSTTSLTAAERRDSFTSSASSGRDRRDSNSSSSSHTSITSMLTRERTARRHSAGAGAFSLNLSQRVRSPLSGSSLSLDDDAESGLPEPEDDEEAAYVRSCGIEALPPPRRPNIETRSWSYDNVRTYPVMAMPAVKEIRVVDGVEVEVEVERPFKKLFSFAPIELRANA